MPSKYSNANEEMVLQEFLKKVKSEEGKASLKKSESPDGIISTEQGITIGIEVTTAIRTNDSAENPNEKHKNAIFLNKYGLFNPDEPRFPTLSETFTADSYLESLLTKIKEQIRKKEANEMYRDFKSRFDKTVLVIYLDDLFLDSDIMNKITSEDFSDQLKIFDEVYIYIRTTYHCPVLDPSKMKQIGGFYLIGQKRKTLTETR